MSCWPQNIYVHPMHCQQGALWRYKKIAAGIVLSGNNYSKVHLLAKQAGMGMVNKSTFLWIQNKYIYGTVQEHANKLMEQNISKLIQKVNPFFFPNGKKNCKGSAYDFDFDLTTDVTVNQPRNEDESVETSSTASGPEASQVLFTSLIKEQ